MCLGFVGERLRVELSQDYEAIKSVLTHPAIWEDIGGEGDPSDWEVPAGALYLLGSVAGAPMGVFVLHGDADSMECHVQVLPQYRKEHAVSFGKRVVDLSSRYTRRLTAEIPKQFPTVHRFAMANGFEVTKEDDSVRWYAREV